MGNEIEVHEEEPKTPENSPEMSYEEFNEFVKDLVANFVREHTQDLQQQIDDLRAVVARPTLDSGFAEVPVYGSGAQQPGEVGWYQPQIGQ